MNQFHTQHQAHFGSFFVLAAAVLWGTTGTAQAFAPPGAHPIAIGVVRLVIGGMALLLWALWRNAFSGDAPWPKWPVFFGAGSTAAYQLFFFAGVSRTGVAVGTMVAIGSAPVLAGVLAWLVRRERPWRRWWWATFLALLGCTLLMGTGNDVVIDVTGIWLAIAAGGAYAVYAVASKELIEKQSPDAVTAVIFTLGAILLLPLLFISDLTWLSQTRGWVAALHLGLVATAVAYALYSRGLMRVPVATAVTLSLAEPLTAATLGILLLGERLLPTALLGMGLLFAGLVLLSVGQRQS